MSTPESVTDQPQVNRGTIDIRVAGFFERVSAAFIDLCIPYGLGVLTFFLWPRPDVMETSRWNAIDRFVDGYNVDPSIVWAPVLVIAISAFSWNLAHGLRNKETLGRRLLGLKTIGRRGQTPTPNEVLLHCVGRLLSTSCLFLGHCWLLADPEKRTWHDRIARLYVILDRRIEMDEAREETLSHSEEPIQ